MLRYFNVTEVRRSDLKAVVYCPLVGKPSNSTNEWIAWVSVQREHEYFRNRYVKKICIYICCPSEDWIIRQLPDE